MRAFGVVPDQPVDKLQIEGMNIVPQQAPIQHDEVLGDGAIESFDVGIHLGSAGAGVKVREPEFGTGILEVFGELAPVVGLQLVDIEGANLDDSAKEVVRASRRVVRIRARKGELPLHVHCREDVPLHAVDEADDGIELHAALAGAAKLGTAFLRCFRVIARTCVEREPALLREQTAVLQIQNDPPNV